MEKLLKQCKWPDLPEPYLPALREAVDFVLAHFEVLGIIVSGTIIRGSGDASSDLDLFVLNTHPRRQRIQKFFNRLPVEIFVNPVHAVEGYFQDERKRGRPCIAHMLATGFVVLSRDPIVEKLQEHAAAMLESTPDPDEYKLTTLRYGAALEFEDAVDVAEKNPAGAYMIMGSAVHKMLQYAFWKANRFLPRDKDLLDTLEELDPKLAAEATEFYQCALSMRRLALAEQIADCTIEVRGFFEWQSDLEEV
jgi:predicted nucleotidyltransferase